MTNSPSAGGVDVFLQNISPSHTALNAHDAKQLINTNLNSKLQELINKPPRYNTKEFCVIGRLLNEMSDVDKEALQKVIDDRRIMTVSIVKVLQEEGHSISDVSFRRHRRQDCVCFR